MSGAKVWPITGETYILVRRSQSTYANGHAMLSFFDWALNQQHGRQGRQEFTFVPLPSAAVKAIKTVWHSTIKAGSKPCW